MADIPLAATVHNATSPVSAEMGLSGQAVQGAIQGATQGATQGAVQSPLSNVGQGAASSALTDVAGNATNAIGTVNSAVNSGVNAVNKAGAAAGTAVPVDQAFSWGGYFQAIAVLLLLMALLWGVVWAMRKYGKFNFMPRPGDFPRESLRVEAQVPLGPRKGLVVVRFLNRRILLGVTDQQITFLTEAGQENEMDTMDFQGIMEEARRQKPDS